MFHRRSYLQHPHRKAAAGPGSCAAFLCAWLVIVFVATAHAAKRGPDVISIAAVLIQDGNYEKALGLLDTISPAEKQKDEARYYFLRGVAALRSAKFDLAQLSFVRAIEVRRSADDERNESVDKRAKELEKIHGYLALSLWALDDCEAALAASEEAGTPESQSAKLFVLRGDCLARSNKASAAFEALRKGQVIHSGNRELLEKELYLLVSLGLYEELKARSENWMSDVTRDEGIRLLAKLNEAEAHPQLVYFGEQLRLRFPRTQKISLFLAQSYRKKGQPLAAARVMEELSIHDASYALDAAELYRRAGWGKVAQIVSAKSDNQAGKIRQHFGMLLEDARFDEAAALTSRLRKTKLLDDDSIRYALAYAQYETGLLDEARVMLRDIQDEKIFRQAAELRQLIDACEAKGWLCR